MPPEDDYKSPVQGEVFLNPELFIDSSGKHLFFQDKHEEGRILYSPRDVVMILAEATYPDDDLKRCIVELITDLSDTQKAALVRAIKDNKPALDAVNDIDSTVRTLLHEIGARPKRDNTPSRR